MSGFKLIYNHFSHKGEQGRHTGESTIFPPMWPGFVYQLCQTWIKFAVGSSLLQGFFVASSPFSSLCKNQHCQIPFSIWKQRTNSYFVEVLLLNPIYLFIFILLMSFLLKSEYCKDTHIYDTLKKSYRVF